MPRQRRIDPIVILLLLLIPLIVVGTHIHAGPLKSGAFFLRWPGPGPSTTHDLPASYEPLHQGHFDLGTGLYLREDDDFVLHATPSFVFRRTYRTQDPQSREFGIGATHSGEWLLVGDQAGFQWVSLVFAGGYRIRFERVSSGTSYRDALFEHRGSATSFAGARLGWSGSDWLLRLQDGSLARISRCYLPPTRCTVMDVRDSDGHRIRFDRDPRMTLLKVDTGAQSIDFSYDGQQRIVAARDSSGRQVRYTYDEAGRLVRAAGSDGTVRSYGYDAMHRMTRVEEPGRIVENAYDADGLLTKQLVWTGGQTRNPGAARPYVYEVQYTMEAGRVRQTDLRQSNGEHKRAVFDRAGHVVSETYAPDTPAYATVTYTRDPVVDGLTTVTVTCRPGRWRSTHSENVEPGREYEVAAQLRARWCSTSSRDQAQIETGR